VFILGHLGFGLELAKPFKRDLPVRPLLLGALLPDLIDKPLYYALAAATGRRGAEIGLVSGTRTFGHTMLFLIGLALLARRRNSRALSAVALGVATHLFLDSLSDAFTRRWDFSLQALLWPCLGWRFPAYPYYGWQDHVAHVKEPFLLCAEIAGAAILAWEWRKARRAALAV
jgi:membrane-bound metal-dependent hydrolase YbcI (DUF457 family)